MHKNENTQKSHSFLALAFFKGICLSRHQRIWNQHTCTSCTKYHVHCAGFTCLTHWVHCSLKVHDQTCFLLSLMDYIVIWSCWYALFCFISLKNTLSCCVAPRPPPCAWSQNPITNPHSRVLPALHLEGERPFFTLRCVLCNCGLYCTPRPLSSWCIAPTSAHRIPSSTHCTVYENLSPFV